MSRILLVFALLLPTSAFAVGDQAYLGIFVETSQQKMVGMPAIELPPGMDLSTLGNIPGMESLLGGGPTRTLTVRLWSPSLAPNDAFAHLAVPAGLKQGEKLILDLYRPKPETGRSETGGTGDDGGTVDPKDFTIKYYWGSSATVKQGQPKVIKFSTMTAEQQQTMRKESEKIRTDSYFYKPNWTTGYWPTKSQPGKIAKDAVLAGSYALTTNYTGNVTIDCPQNVNFLAGIDMTSPKLDQKIPMEAAIPFKWKPIPNLLGSHAMIMGMEGENTMIIWSSSEIWREDMMSVDWGFMQMAEVQEMVKATIMMKGDRTDVTVPAGIFKDCDFVSMTMVGYGPGVARAETQPLPRIQTKTSLNLMLGGKSMDDMGMDMDDEDYDE